MGIDWFTCIAQIFNLILLLFLLRKFLYLPVLKAVEARQRLIREELKKAEDSRLKADKAEKMCLAKAQEIESGKQQILANVRQAADKLAADLQEKAENQYHQEKANWKKRLQNERQSFDAELQKFIVEQFNNFAAKAISQMADHELNELIIGRFIAEIENSPQKEKTKWNADFKGRKQVTIQTAFALSSVLKERLENTLHRVCGLDKNAKFIYELNPEIIAGVVLQSGERIIQWNLFAYLQDFKQTMEKEVSRLINKGA